MTASLRRAVRLEHRLTKPTASLADLEAAVALATQHELAALTVNPWLVRAAKRGLGGSRVSLGTVIAYPHGATTSSAKAFEASAALDQGAAQIDFVLNAGALASDDEDTAFADMVAVVDMAHSALAAAGVIVEPVPLPDELVRRACRLAERAGADYVVAGSASMPEHVAGRVRLLRDTVGPRIGVKVHGAFETVDELDAVVDAGATRVSTEVSPALAAEVSPIRVGAAG